ncbi:F0F1 ATP synthase subunit epsilon [Solimicrobium silvestre]|uniref:Alternate F1F0 ATPase, F1 subunit epsilon n=1 Tax=Solimicrobium silvestre TaxID=2099400 RepID=A0A2S9GW41_9BURK|nr:F0F1 ATP synthase subunit epsilon [Solimicrobium silvestre]PRC91930.1 Alternate F1F0 ATPase, F1 subunit epsilon [Solimicrobium silvestre]
MHLKVLLPFQIFADKPDVARIVAQTPHGSFGLLPNRLDCVTALSPGILSYAMANGEEFYLAVDEGLLVKIGAEVLVSVRNAIGGTDLGHLHETIQKDFLTLDAQEQSVRSVMSKLESNFIQRFAAFHHVQ